jgi:IS5 family transposase
MGNPVERLASTIAWESFRPLLAQVHEKERKSNAGRKAIKVVLMSKVLILQTPYNLSDEEVEYQIRNRLSSGRFLGFGIKNSVPDATTVWGFRERLKELELMEALFDAQQQANNRRRSKVRSRVDNIFRFQQHSMGCKLIRTIGLARAEVKISLWNLSYNLMRYVQLTKRREGAPATA